MSLIPRATFPPLLLLTAFAPVQAALQPAATPTPASASASGASVQPVFSSDGRAVAFISSANNLVTNDNRNVSVDVFAHNVETGTTRLVSANALQTGGGNGNSHSPSLSTNGETIVFASDAQDLVPDDINHATDIFRHHLPTGLTTLISTRDGQPAIGDTPHHNGLLSQNPTLSEDGHVVVYQSRATNLVDRADSNQASDIFYWNDAATPATTLVSINALGDASGLGDSTDPAMTPDGRWIAFRSTAPNLVDPPATPGTHIFVRDMQTLETRWVSQTTVNYIAGDVEHLPPVLSADGRFLAFKATGRGQRVPVLLFLHSLETGQTTLIASNSAEHSLPQLSVNGSRLAYDDEDAVWVWDGSTATRELVSVSTNGVTPANGASSRPRLSSDGAIVTFLSTATDLVTNTPSARWQVFLRDLNNKTTHLISVATNSIAGLNQLDTFTPDLSPDGSLVAFESPDPTLAADDRNQAEDVFVRNWHTETTTLLSTAHPAATSSTSVAGTLLLPGWLNTNAAVLLLRSYDNNFAAGDTNGRSELLIIDRSDHTARRVAPGQTAFEGTLDPAGRHVAYVDRYPFPDGVQQNLPGRLWRFDGATGTYQPAGFTSQGLGAHANETSSPAFNSTGDLLAFANRDIDGDFSTWDVYVHNFTATNNPQRRISTPLPGFFRAESVDPRFSPDDRWITFVSDSVDMTSESSPLGIPQIYAHDLLSNSNHLVSYTPSGSDFFSAASNHAFSADSRYIAFELEGDEIYLHDVSSDGANRLACADCGSPSLNQDGNLLAFETRSNPPFTQIHLKNLALDQTTLVSANPLDGSPANGDSSNPLLTPDGRFVIFISGASDLVEHDDNGAKDIFIRDVAAGTTLLASINFSGTAAGNGPSLHPVLSPDGRTVAFQSFASDLIPDDFNDDADVFLLRLGGGDTDGDNLDDDWEMTYFGTLDRDGTGDFDEDGSSDHDEFLAGTNPADGSSVFRVLTLTRADGGPTSVIWSAVAGKVYQVEFKEDVTSPGWAQLGGPVTATGSTASTTDDSSTSRRFYRVRLE